MFYSYPIEVYTVFSFLSFILVLIPLPWHLQAWNTGTCCFMIWTALGALNFFINSIVWNGKVSNFAPVWCDISSKLIIGLNTAIPAAALCINRRLYYIATANAVTTTNSEKRRAILIDLGICVGIPVLNMVLHYIPQGHRFDIFEDFGCFPSTYTTWVSMVLVSAWPLAISSVSGVYCVLTLWAFNKRRQQFKEFLSKHTNTNQNRYLRLMCLAGVDIIVTIPLSTWGIYNNVANGGLSPWISWEDTHSNFSRVKLVPSLFWKSAPLAVSSLEATRWVIVLCAFVFFGFFGFADEARRNYKAAFDSTQKKVGINSTLGLNSTLFGSRSNVGKSTTSSGTSTAGGTLPVFVKHEVRRKRDTLDTFSDMASIATAEKNLDAPKSFDPDASCGIISLTDIGFSDVGGTLTSSRPTSRASSCSSSYIDTEKDEDDIEISSLRFSHIPPPPEPAHLKKEVGDMV